MTSMPPSKPEKVEEKGEEGTKVHAPLPPPVTTRKKGVELRRVDHTYRDYSDYPPSAVAKKAYGKLMNFPAKLHEILSTPDFECAIAWMPHGRAWRINSKEIFIREVVPKYFGQSKYQSFARQLNGWGFKRLNQAGNDFNAYYHEQFLRGLPHLTPLMTRVPPNQGRLLPFAGGEPNFYDIEKRYPLVGQPTMMIPNQGQQSHITGGEGSYGAPSQVPARMPYHGHDDDQYAHMAAYNSQISGGHYPHPYSTQYGYNPYYGFNPHGQYPHYYSYHHHDMLGNSSQGDNVDPAVADSLTKGIEEVTVGGEDSVDVEDNQAASDSSPSDEPSAITCAESVEV